VRCRRPRPAISTTSWSTTRHLPGQSNRGHTYSDDLTDAEVAALLEYLKTL
jgi:hypothetical protein